MHQCCLLVWGADVFGSPYDEPNKKCVCVWGKRQRWCTEGTFFTHVKYSDTDINTV